jgi:hypothetical protein
MKHGSDGVEPACPWQTAIELHEEPRLIEVILRPDIREQSYLVARERSASKW